MMNVLPDTELVGRFGEILDEMDALARDLDGEVAEALEELNAEFEDALMLLGELEPRDADYEEALQDALEELRALAADYLRLAEGPLPEAGEPARRLEGLAA